MAGRDYQPGDLLAFSGNSLESMLIELGTWGIPLISPSHVAVVGLHPVERRPVLWESTGLCDQACLLQGRRVKGVQVHEIDKRIASYQGRVYHLPLTSPLNSEEAHWLTVFLHAHLGAKYDTIGALRAREMGFGWFEHLFGRESLNSIFCSEYAAAALRAVDRFMTANASKWNPNSLCRALLRTGVCS